MTKPDKQSSSHLWTHSVTTQVKRKLMMITLFLRRYNSQETQSRCCILDKIVHSAGSRIANLAYKLICNHHLCHGARRLHLSSDFSERRSSNTREARNTKASTQGYVKEHMSCAAAAYS